MNKDIKKIAVIGDPVAHSLSPRIHGYWIARYNVRGSYEAVRIPAGDFDAGIDDLLRRGFAGWNVTIPHKVAMLHRCDTLDDAARSIGAVNMVAVGADGRLHGMNTDAYGALAHLDQAAPAWRAGGDTALVLGAGGAARALVWGLRDAGVKHIRLTNRTRSKADALAADFSDAGITVVNWDARDDAVAGCGVIVNTTALGMTGQGPLTLSLEKAGKDAVIYDIVYKPLRTPLLQDAQKRGLQTVNGLGMLLHQARPAFAAWFGILPDVDKALIETLGVTEE